MNLRELAERIERLNELRDDQFQERALQLIDQARDRYRLPSGDLPDPGENAELDALSRLATQLDASPEAVREACRLLPVG